MFGNQLKSVVGKKMVAEYTTQSGEIIDAIYGTLSVENRIVTSPIVIGMHNVLLDLTGQEMLAAYES